MLDTGGKAPYHACMPLPEMLTTDEVARAARVHPRTVMRWARDHELPATKISGRYRFRRSDVERLLTPTAPAEEQAAS